MALQLVTLRKGVNTLAASGEDTIIDTPDDVDKLTI